MSENKNNIQTACIVLIILTITIIIISFLYDKQNTMQNANRNSMDIESFVNYQDVKTKTLNWCNKMQKTGLLTSDQFDECVSTFKDTTTGFLPKEFPVPNTGIPRNYSLYNTRIKSLVPNISGENTNTVMLVNNMGFYMGCNSDNSVYFTKDINSDTVNQQEIYFTLVPQNNTVYSIMSSYGKYLIANNGPNDINDKTIPAGQSSRQDWCSSFTGKTTGPMTNWNVKNYETENNNGGISKVTFEAVQISNFFLSSNQNSQDNSLQIVYGSDDTTLWKMIPKQVDNNDSQSDSANASTEYLVKKDNIVTNLSTIKSQIICIQAFIDTLVKLQDMVKNNYSNIQNYVFQILSGTVTDISSSINPINPIPTTDPQELDPFPTLADEIIDQDILSNPENAGPGDSKASENTVPNTTQSNPTQPIVEGFANSDINMSIDEKNAVINTIINMQNTYLQQIDSDLSRFNILLTELKTKETTIDSDYNIFLTDLANKLSEVKSNIARNNDIMNRQKHTYDKLNSDYEYIEGKKDKTEKKDEISKLNIDLVSNYSNNNSTLVKVYPLIIFIIILCLLYLCYSTYGKFMSNVYVHY